MTLNTPPKVEIGWEPVTEGVQLFLESGNPNNAFSGTLPMSSVMELRDDMEEALQLARRMEKVDCMASEVLQYDKVYIAGNVLMVSDVLSSREGTTLQFGEGYTEVTMPSDQQITVYRGIE